jgi:Xaa-Pro dipeptidase
MSADQGTHTPGLTRAARAAQLYRWEQRESHLKLPFAAEEYSERVGKARAAMAAAGLDAVVVCGDSGHPGDVRWLANWRPGIGIAFLVLPLSGEPVLVLYDEVFSFDLCATWVHEIVPPQRGTGALAATGRIIAGRLGELGSIRRLGVVGETALPMAVQQEIHAAMPRLEILDAGDLFSGVRAVKSPAEIAVLRRAVAQSDAAMGAAVSAIRSGQADNECAAVGAALAAMYLAGAEGPSFAPLVVAGPRTRWKHAGPTLRPFSAGEPIYIDLGAMSDGYCGDLSRTVVLGRPAKAQAHLLEFALAATEAMKRAARPGITARRLREAGDEVAAEFGLAGQAGGAGHGLGCKLREEPLLDPTNELPLQPGMVIAIEPMYVGELGTFVIEDDILVTESGSEYLSHSPRQNWE